MSFGIQTVLMVLQRKRTCPNCRREQVVLFRQRHATVPCKFCGEPVPPPKR